MAAKNYADGREKVKMERQMPKKPNALPMLASKRQLIMQEITEADNDSDKQEENAKATEDFQRKLEQEKRRQSELAMQLKQQKREEMLN